MKGIRPRPYVQGNARGLRVERGDCGVIGGAGLLPFRGAWDRLGIGRWLEERTQWVGGRYGTALMVETWVMLLLYGGGRMDDLRWLGGRGIRRLFGWKSVPDPVTYGRWLRRGGERLAQVLDDLLWQVVRAQWSASGVPRRVLLVLDSTVVLRYGKKQAGAVLGYNPRKRGRPSHHPLLAFLGTGECMGVRWRPGNANCAAGAQEWIEQLVRRLRKAGVERIVVRLDKGFFSQAMVRKLQDLKVEFVVKMQESNTLQKYKGVFSQHRKNPGLWSSEGELWGARLLSVEERRELSEAQGELGLGYELRKRASVVTNVRGIGPLRGWKLYNRGAVVEHRIEEFTQLSVGKTAVDDLGGNHLLWALGALAYGLHHFVRRTALPGRWRTAQPKTLRTWLFQMPAKLVRHARTWRVRIARDEPFAELLLSALAAQEKLRAPPLCPA